MANRAWIRPGVNGGVLAEVLPEIELILGKQPGGPALGSVEAQNRFIGVLQSFLAIVATPQHPARAYSGHGDDD